MIGDYLPTSLQSYLDLPRGYATAPAAAGKHSPHDELLDLNGRYASLVARDRTAADAVAVD